MAKRILKGVILFFALYAFVFVPLGKKTALQHIRAILGTSAAQEAASEVKGGVTRLVKRLETEARKSTEATDRLIEHFEEEEEDLDDSAPEGDRSEAEGRRALPKPRLQTLSAEKPASF